jgi:hypothetical protein
MRTTGRLYFGQGTLAHVGQNSTRDHRAVKNTIRDIRTTTLKILFPIRDSPNIRAN